MPGVKPPSGYSSPRRKAAKEATIRAILDASWRLFSARGYSQTTIAAIAAEAGVAIPTVYFCFGSKAAIATRLTDVLEREARIIPLYEEALADAPARRRLELMVTIARQAGEATARFLDIVRTSREPALLDAWERMDGNGRAGIGDIIGRIAEHGDLRPGLSPTKAADMVWVMTSPEVYMRLTQGSGWTGEEYHRQMVDALAAAILSG